MTAFNVWNSIAGLGLIIFMVVARDRLKANPFPVLMTFAIGCEAVVLLGRGLVSGVPETVWEGVHVLAGVFLVAWATRRFIGNLDRRDVS